MGPTGAQGTWKGEAGELGWDELAKDPVCQVRSHKCFITQAGVEDGVGQGIGTTCLKFGKENIPTSLFTRGLSWAQLRRILRCSIQRRESLQG